MRLPQAIERCRELMGHRRENQRPVALAWQPGRLDWYELRDFDRRVMRLFSCDGAQAWAGHGVQRVRADRLPLTEGRDEVWTDLFEGLRRAPVEGVRALEAALGVGRGAALGPASASPAAAVCGAAARPACRALAAALAHPQLGTEPAGGL
ncbi:MAG: hypothetical protein RJA10_174 [Pseudomonadota bacterium]